jgi:RNA polymerase sigma factor (sigma-70 family)
MPDDWTDTFEAHRERLFNLAYRMLGRVQDAEDAVQDAYLRWRSVAPDTVDAPGAYLTTNVTRLCLDELSAARAERATYTGPWLPEPTVAPLDRPDRAAEHSDAVSFALLVMMETLSPRQRVVYVLREVLDTPYAKIADIVDESTAYCRKLAQRARGQTDATDVEGDVSAAARADLVDDFVAAIADGDAEAVARTLAEDVVMTCDGGTPHTIAALAPHARSVLAAPGDLHLSFVDADLLSTVADVTSPEAWTHRLAERAFGRLTGRVATAVTLAAYDADRTAPAARRLAGRARPDTSTAPTGVRVWHRPARFGPQADRATHSGWACRPAE